MEVLNNGFKGNAIEPSLGTVRNLTELTEQVSERNARYLPFR